MVLSVEERDYLRELVELPGWQVLDRWVKSEVHNAVSKVLSPTTTTLEEINLWRGRLWALEEIWDEIEQEIRGEEE